MFQNAHLEGRPFYWKKNKIGILLFHGLTASTAEVRPLAKFLSSKGYSVSCPLLPGHLTSPRDLNNRSWLEWAQAGEDAYQQLKKDCDHIFLAGASMGGLVALDLARSHPNALALLLYAPAIRIPRMWLIALIYPFIPYLKKKTSSRPMEWQGYTVRSTHAVNQLRIFQEYIRKNLTKIHQPTLILQGELDQTVDPQGAQQLFNALASERKELFWLTDSTHCVILDRQFDLVCQKTEKFINSILERI